MSGPFWYVISASAHVSALSVVTSTRTIGSDPANAVPRNRTGPAVSTAEADGEMKNVLAWYSAVFDQPIDSQYPRSGFVPNRISVIHFGFFIPYPTGGRVRCGVPCRSGSDSPFIFHTSHTGTSRSVIGMEVW